MKLVVSKSTNVADGVDLSAEYIIDNNVADLISESFGECEANFTQAQATFYSNLAKQAAAEGITFVVASGDSGASGCDAPRSPAATGPLSVNMLASSPFATAVGGTMFNENGNDRTYWLSYNYFGQASVMGPIPEKAWNESCSGAACGINGPGLWASGGGASRFFSKPAWQTGMPGILEDNARDLPDVALTAAQHDAYLMCLKNSCTLDASGRISFTGGSGTSAATPSFAGMIALAVQKYNRQGQINSNLYRLAATQDWSQCDSANHGSVSNFPCVFADITTGDNAVPGQGDYGVSAPSYQANSATT